MTWPLLNPPNPTHTQESFLLLIIIIILLFSSSWLLIFYFIFPSYIIIIIISLSSLRSRRRYHRAQRDSICLSVCHLSSVCHQTPPSLWNRSLPKFIFGFFRPLRGSVKIWYWPQSNPRPPTPSPPKKWPPQNENLYFLTYWLEILFITSWPLPHHKSAWISITRCATAHVQIHLF